MIAFQNKIPPDWKTIQINVFLVLFCYRTIHSQVLVPGLVVGDLWSRKKKNLMLKTYGVHLEVLSVSVEEEADDGRDDRLHQREEEEGRLYSIAQLLLKETQKHLEQIQTPMKTTVLLLLKLQWCSDLNGIMAQALITF